MKRKSAWVRKSVLHARHRLQNSDRLQPILPMHLDDPRVQSHPDISGGQNLIDEIARHRPGQRVASHEHRDGLRVAEKCMAACPAEFAPPTM